MELSYKKYPYPVLMPRGEGDDYSIGEFEIEIFPVKREKEVEIEFRVSLSCQSIETLVADASASVICHIECSQSAYRKAECIPLEGKKITIPSNCLSGKVFVCPFIVTAKCIQGYTSPAFNEDYQGFTFDLECGAVIAVGTEKRFFVETSKNDLEYTPDIFSVIPYDNDEGEIQFDTVGNKICIKLPRQVFGYYNALLTSESNNEFLWSAIIFPALVDALYQIRDKAYSEGLGELEDLVWYRTISSKIAKLYAVENLEAFLKEMSVVSVAQRLINLPVSVALKKLGDIGGRQDED